MITKTPNNGLHFNGVEFISGGKETFYGGKLHVKSRKNTRPIPDLTLPKQRLREEKQKISPFANVFQVVHCLCIITCEV